jgi:hypothetical protein
MRDALEPTPRKGTKPARFGARAAVIGLALVLVSGLGPRLGILSSTAAMGSWALGSLALLIALVAAGFALLRGFRKSSAWLAFLAGAVITGINLNLSRGMDSPWHDISTDTVNPPAFVAAAVQRTPDEAPVAYAGPAQPPADIMPLMVSAATSTVFARTLDMVTDRDWTLVEANQETGRIEATAETGWFRFRSDVVIRIADIGGRTRVDVRSQARLPRGSMGVDEKLVRAFLADLRNRLSGA